MNQTKVILLVCRIYSLNDSMRSVDLALQSGA